MVDQRRRKLIYRVRIREGRAGVWRHPKGSFGVDQANAVDSNSDPDRDYTNRLGVQLLRQCGCIRSLAVAEEGDAHRSPEPGDLLGPPADRLVGGTGGPVDAQLPDRRFRHTTHHGSHPD